MTARTANRLTALAVLILLGTTGAATYTTVQARHEATALRAHINGMGYPCRMAPIPRMRWQS